MTARVLCAWCGVVMAPGDEPASHGICGPCLALVEERELDVLAVLREGQRLPRDVDQPPGVLMEEFGR